jgi:hypothetical protein
MRPWRLQEKFLAGKSDSDVAAHRIACRQRGIPRGFHKEIR